MFDHVFLEIVVQQPGQTILSQSFGLVHDPPLFIYLSNAENCGRIGIWNWEIRDVFVHANILPPPCY